MSKPLEVVLGEGQPKVVIDGETYKMSPLRLKDFGKFRDWVKQNRLSSFMKVARESGMDYDEWSPIVKEILASRPVTVEGDDGEISVEDDVLEQMNTGEGMQYLLYLSIRRNHPEIEESDIDLGFEQLEELAEVLAEISGLADIAEEDEEESAEGNESL